MKFSFAKKLTLSYLFVVLLTLVFAGLYLTPRLKNGFLAQIENSLSGQAHLMAQTVVPLLSHASRPALSLWVKERAALLGCRITLVDQDGHVLSDSERTEDQVKVMDNHAMRPEIQAAVQTGFGEAMRHSDTLREDMLYVAAPIHDSKTTHLLGVLRVALPLTEVHMRIAGFQKDLLKTGAFGTLLAVIVALLTVRRINQPLEELMGRIRQVTEIETPPDTDEFRQLAGTIDGLAGKIADKVDELGREKTQLGAILSALLEGVIAIDHRSRILFLNPAAEQMFGVLQKDIQGRPFLEGLRHSALTEILTESLNTHQLVTREIILHTPDERVLRVHARPVDYGHGATGVLAALHDITEVRHLEGIRQEFFSNASHELKTPLTSIKGFVETLLEGALEDPEHNRAFLETIQEQTNRLMRLIEDILDLSAIEARRVPYRFESIDLKPVIDRLFAALEPQAKTQEVKLILELPKDVNPIRADREKLAQLLLNLIDNAIKFNRPGGKVMVQAKNSAPDKVEISVADTGMGIDERDLPRIFERFYRSDKSHSQTIPGTGLGLAIVKHVVDAHQGTLSVQSQIDTGTVFHVTFPAASL